MKELAKLANEKGFKCHTITTVYVNNFLLGGIGKRAFLNDISMYLWLCELQKWLLINNIDVVSIPSRFIGHDDINHWFYQVKGFCKDHRKNRFNSNIEALQAGLFEGLNEMS